MIEPVYIRTFIDLTESGNFTRTAERLNMTQPGVSQHIKRLEDYFHVELLTWQGKKFLLTEAGKKLAEYGKSFFKNHDEFRNSLGGDDAFSGLCRYASPGSYGFKLFDGLMDCAEKHPNLKVSLMVSPNESIPRLLLDNKIDIGFMTMKPEFRELEIKSHGEEELLLIIPKKLKKVNCTLSGLQEMGFVRHPDAGYFADRLFASNFGKQYKGVEMFPVKIFINQVNRILDPVSRGLGFTVLPEYAFLQYPKRDALSICKLPKPARDPIYKVTRLGEKLPERFKTVEKFISPANSLRS